MSLLPTPICGCLIAVVDQTDRPNESRVTKPNPQECRAKFPAAEQFLVREVSNENRQVSV